MAQRASLKVNTQHLADREREGAVAGLKVALEHLLQASREIVPHEEGTLERSGTTSVDGLKGAVSYDTVYAARQHEELTWRHDPPRSAKYLEGPAVTEWPQMQELIAAQIRRSLR
ncbi:hypothetical protein AB0K05_24920 [Nonomuraea sp. NPDC049486]|uniref:hypothetical protein n=1 Tax=Nonomuraea sp. NPDC049486 TaxID=3155773 RepID=UPI00342147F2